MTTEQRVPIRNIYCMLCYVSGYKPDQTADNYGEEDFDNIYEVLARFLDDSFRPILRRGLHREYVPQSDTLTMPRGKIDFEGTFRECSKRSRRVHCEFDEFTADNRLNQIIRWTFSYLSRHGDLEPATADSVMDDLNRLFMVSDIRLDSSYFDSISLNSMNKGYEMVLNICRLVYELKLINEENEFAGKRFAFEKGLEYIYEKFLYSFFQLRFTDLDVEHKKIKWDLVEGSDGKDLPEMQTDVFIRNPRQKRDLVIDAKFYHDMMGSRNESSKATLISSNLYQVFTYINSYKPLGKIDGMLIYPQVNREPYRKTFFFRNGRDMTVLSVNLDDEWSNIDRTLMSVHAYCVD